MVFGKLRKDQLQQAGRDHIADGGIIAAGGDHVFKKRGELRGGLYHAVFRRDSYAREIIFDHRAVKRDEDVIERIGRIIVIRDGFVWKAYENVVFFKSNVPSGVSSLPLPFKIKCSA